MTLTVLAVRVLHVVLGAFWFGAVLFSAAYLDPTVREMGADGGRLMGILARRGFQRTMMVVATITVLTGVWLLWRLSGGFSSGFMGSGSGILLSTGGLLGILGLLVGGHVTSPTGKRLGAIGAKIQASGAPPSAEDLSEIGRLQRRLTFGLRAVTVLVLLAVALMALGPHL